jgi:hypothetical protein
MTKHPIYLAWGIFVIVLASMAEWRGWTFIPVSEARVAPRSVRENPGAYRPVYRGGTGRYMRGK